MKILITGNRRRTKNYGEEIPRRYIYASWKYFCKLFYREKKSRNEKILLDRIILYRGYIGQEEKYTINRTILIMFLKEKYCEKTSKR